MTLGAHVGSVDALLRLRASLASFISAADKALCESAIEIDRTADWVAHDQQARWTAEARKRHDAVIKAQDEVRRAQWSIGEHKPAAIEQKKALKKAEERLAQAKEKLANVARWKREFAQAANEYKGQVQHITSALDADLPRAVAALDQIIDSIGSYLAVQAPAGAADDISGIETAGASMAQPERARRGPMESEAERRDLLRRLRERARAPVRDAIAINPGLAADSTPQPALQIPEFAESPDAPSTPCRPGDVVVLELAALALEGDDLFFARLPSCQRGDSGWYIGRIDAEPAADDIVGTTAARLLLLRPDWRSALGAPPGNMLLVRGSAIERIEFEEDGSIT